MKFGRSCIFLGTALTLFLSASQVEAHWCDDLWVSNYNLVVRPESDTVTVPSSGSGSLVVYVQNNMSYLLPNFELTAKASGATITATRSGDKVSGTLLPGERGKYTLAITKSGGGTVSATDIDFSVSFGSSGQSNMYPSSGGKAAMIRSTDGSLVPTPPPPGLGQGGGQAADLNASAVADYGSTSEGMDRLLQLYCAGRGSWNSGSFTNIKSNCPDTSTTVCPTSTPSSGSGDKFMYPRLWAAGYMAIRKSALDSRAAVLRQRLQCGVNDSNTCFAGFALMVLGYLGEDSEARAFIEGKANGSGDLATIAKAALVLMGNGDDLTKHKSALTSGASSSSTYVKAACAAALGIAAKDDATVNSTLIPLAKWVEPDTSDNGQGLYASALLQLVAMDRRGWAPKAGDSGAVTFYGETGSGAGGNRGTGGRTAGGNGGAPGGTGGESGMGGTTGGRGGRSGTSSTASGTGGSTGRGNGGRTATTPAGTGGGSAGPGGSGGGVEGSGGQTSAVGVGGGSGVVAAGGSSGAPPTSGGEGGSSGPTGSAGDSGPGTENRGSSGGCSVGGPARTEALSLLAMAGLAFLVGRRRRR